MGEVFSEQIDFLSSNTSNTLCLHSVTLPTLSPDLNRLRLLPWKAMNLTTSTMESYEIDHGKL